MFKKITLFNNQTIDQYNSSEKSDDSATASKNKKSSIYKIFGWSFLTAGILTCGVLFIIATTNKNQYHKNYNQCSVVYILDKTLGESVIPFRTIANNQDSSNAGVSDSLSKLIEYLNTFAYINDSEPSYSSINEVSFNNALSIHGQWSESEKSQYKTNLSDIAKSLPDIKEFVTVNQYDNMHTFVNLLISLDMNTKADSKSYNDALIMQNVGGYTFLGFFIVILALLKNLFFFKDQR